MATLEKITINNGEVASVAEEMTMATLYMVHQALKSSVSRVPPLLLSTGYDLCPNQHRLCEVAMLRTHR